jgi:hypothetical protein
MPLTGREKPDTYSHWALLSAVRVGISSYHVPKQVLLLIWGTVAWPGTFERQNIGIWVYLVFFFSTSWCDFVHSSELLWVSACLVYKRESWHLFMKKDLWWLNWIAFIEHLVQKRPPHTLKWLLLCTCLPELLSSLCKSPQRRRLDDSFSKQCLLWCTF